MADWVPKTRLGQMVLNGDITTMSDALATKLPLREPEIVDILLPDLKDEVIDLNMVQRMTDSGTPLLTTLNPLLVHDSVSGDSVSPYLKWDDRIVVSIK